METSRVPDSDCRYVSTLQVAEALGVGVTTVKRWVDGGVLPAHRTAGGHRKLLMADVLRLVREGGLPQVDLSKLLPVPRGADVVDPSRLCEQLIEALAKPDGELVRSIIHGAYQRGLAIETVADRIVGPAMHDIGHQWEVGAIDVLQEHRATQTVLAALYELKSQLRTQVDRDRPVAVGGAPENDHTLLGSLLAKLVLLDAGWNAVNLGPHTPIGALRAAMHDLRPRLIWISACHLNDVATFLKEYVPFYREAEEQGVAIAIGGRAFSDPVRSQMPYTTFGDGLTHLAAFAKLLFAIPKRPRRGRPPTDAK